MCIFWFSDQKQTTGLRREIQQELEGACVGDHHDQEAETHFTGEIVTI